MRRLLLCLLATSIVGCFGGGSDDPGPRSGPLTVYTSLPGRGPSAEDAEGVLAGQRRALADAGGRAGGRRVRLVVLESTGPEPEPWSPESVDANAQRAVDDSSAVAYLGELAYGASAVSLPVTNDDGLLQVSPGDGLASLTVSPPGSPGRGAPERYYPSGERTFLRLVPSDLVLARAIVGQMKERGVEEVGLLSEDRVYGREFAGLVQHEARVGGMRITASEEVPDEPGDTGQAGRDLLEKRPDAVVYAGTPDLSTRPMLFVLGRDAPGTPVLGGSGLVDDQVTASLPAAPRELTALSPVLPASERPAAGRRLARRLGGPEGLLGYESMSVVLDAIERGGPDRAAVMREALRPRTRRSVLGRYRILRGGDVDERRLSLLRLAGGRVLFERVLR